MLPAQPAVWGSSDPLVILPGAGDGQSSKNIFTSSAASGVLTNDLVKILLHEEV